MLESSLRSLPPKSAPATNPDVGLRCRPCCHRLETLSADLRCIHLELRRLHVTLTNQLHTLKEAALRPRRRSTGSPLSPNGDPPPGLAPLAIARSLEESVGAELRHIRTAVLHLREDLRDCAHARSMVFFGDLPSRIARKENQMASLPTNGIVFHRAHGTGSLPRRLNATLPKKNHSSHGTSSDVQQHYTGNKWRNAQVREDIPRARDEQQKEMEEAAIVHALHERMLQRQEEIDAQVAQQLAEKIEHEEWSRKRQVEERDKEIARQLQERERIRLERLREERERVQIVQGADGPMVIPESSPDLSPPPRVQPPLMHHQHMVYQQHSAPVQMAHHYSPKMAVTRTNQMLYSDEDIAAELGSLDLGAGPRRHGNHMYREERNPEFYHTGSSTGEDEHSDYSLNATPGISLEEAKRMQEEQDAELARLLQEQEGKRGGGGNVDPLDRDRLLAVEAQDRELARMLQERERAKARRARERGRQRALLKKQQQREQQMLENGGMNGEEDDDEPEYGTVVSNGTDNEAEDHKRRTPIGQGSPPSTLPPHGANGSVSRADRPTDLDLTGSRGRRASTGVKAKPRQRYPDPEAIEVLSSVGTADSPSIGSSRCANIAMAIDPTYPRRAHPASPPSPAISSLSRGSSPAVGAVAGIGSGSASSSPGMSLPPPDFEEDDSPVPPYMPIQGQRRTSSLEKKGKKGKQKDGCRQQ